jgi:outer membrane usher protein
MGHRERLLVAVSCTALACAWSSAARAADDEAAFFELFVNSVDQGNVFVVLREGDVYVERKDLASAGLSHFTGEEEKIQGKDMMSLASIQPRVKFDVDEDNIVLKLDVPIEMLPSHAYDLTVMPEDISYHNRASAFFNYSPTLTVTTSQSPAASSFFEGGINENNRLWYSGINATTQGGFSRNLTNLTVDDRLGMVHFIIGDANVSTGPIGAASLIGGLTFARDFSLNPYFVRFPSMRFASATDVPATVDVYVNGIRVKSLPVDPGTFTLDNIRAVTGGGTVQYVLRDALGGVQSMLTPYYVGVNVLKKGLEDFAISGGFPRVNVGIPQGIPKYDVLGEYQMPAFLGYYRRGISDSLTLGARAEGQWGTVLSGGPDIAGTTDIGLFELELAGSAAEAPNWQTGAAAIFTYQYLSRRFGLTGSFRALTSRYAYVQLSPVQDRALYEASASISVPVGTAAALTGQLTFDIPRDAQPLESIGMFTTVKLTKTLSVVGQVAFGTESPPQPSFDGLLSLSWVPDTLNHMSAGLSVASGEPGFNAQYSRSSTFGEDWGMSAAVQVTQATTEVSIAHRLQTSSNILQTNFDWLGGVGDLSVNPSGALVWVAGHGWFVSRPITDAFALVRVPGVKNVRIYLNSQMVGRTNEKGEILVPALVSFYGSQLKLASEDVPLNFQLDKDVITIAPPHRGAGFAEFLAKRIHYFRGRVTVERDGKNEIPEYGDLSVRDHDRENLSPLSEKGEFELEGLSTGTHYAEVRYTKGVCKFKLDAKESDASIIDLGIVHCNLNAPVSR